MVIERNEVLRYLGYGGQPLSKEVEQAIDDMIREFTENIEGRHVVKRVTVERPAEGGLLLGGLLETGSAKLTRNLEGCVEAFLLGATLGAEADQLISRYTRRDVSKGAIAEAVATAMIEVYCDEVCQALETELKEAGRQKAAADAETTDRDGSAAAPDARREYLRPRFSPGYGDFDIGCQRELLQLLDGPRAIGLTLTDSLMLAPTKSVTAVMGISAVPATERGCEVQGCEVCGKQDCVFRRNM